VGPDVVARAQVETVVVSLGHGPVGVDFGPAVVVVHDPAGVAVEETLWRSEGLRARVPVLLVSERSEPRAVARLLGSADDLLPWPVAGEVLDSRLARLARLPPVPQPLVAAEARFRAALDGSFDSVYFLDAVRGADRRIEDFLFVDVNRRGAALLNQTRAGLLGKKIAERFPVDRLGGLVERLMRVVETGEPLEEELAVDLPFVAARWIRHQIVKVGDGIAVTSRDVSERHAAEAALRDSEARLRVLFDGAEREAQRYRTLARHIPNGAVILYDHDLRYTVVDGGGLVEAGLDPTAMQGHTPREIFGDALAQEIEPTYRAALDGRPGRLEAVWAGRDYELTCVPVRDAAGRVEGGLALTQDLTARKRAERALREQRERLGEILGAIPALVVGTDQSGQTTFVNPAAERASGYPGEELLARGFWETVAPGKVAEMLATLDATGHLRDHAMVLHTRGGDRRMISWTADRQGGKSPETFVFGLDVTDRNQMQERLVISERMASVGTLAAGVAHEINNPLTYVLANLYLAAQGLDRLGDPLASVRPSASELKGLVTEARQGAERVSQIVRDLRMFSRADEERSELVDLKRCLDSCLQMAANELRHRAHVIRDYHPVGAVRANDARLGQVFLNLLMNAAQALPEGREQENQVRVALGSDARGYAVVEVADNGSGIDPATLRRVFDPFFTTKPVGVGTGLGLAIAHRIVTGFGGELSVESELGRGSTFRVALPMSSTVLAPSAPAVKPRAAARRGRVLVVEDDELVGVAIRRTLAEHDVTLVTSAEDALARLAAGPAFDVILCDLMLPEVSGVDLHARIAAARPEQAARMIFLTGGAFTPRARAFLEKAPHARLEKPFDPAELRAIVNERVAGP